MAGWGKSHTAELYPGFYGTPDMGFHAEINHFAQQQLLRGLQAEFHKISQENAARPKLMANTVHTHGAWGRDIHTGYVAELRLGEASMGCTHPENQIAVNESTCTCHL